MGRKSQYITHQQAVELISQIVPNQPQRDIKTWLAAMSAGAVNGALTGGDIIVSGLIMVVFISSGFLLSGLSVLVGVPWADCKYYIIDVSRIGIYLGLIRIAVDGLDLYNFWGETIGRILAHREKTVSRTPSYTLNTPPVAVREKQPEQTLYILPNGQEIDPDKLVDMLRSAVNLGDTYWSREYWCNKPDAKERPGVDLLTTRQWAGIRQLCIEGGPVVDGNDVSLWRTNDKAAIELLLQDEGLTPPPSLS